MVHISTVASYPNGRNKPPTFEADGVCHCARPVGKTVPWFGGVECATCHRPVHLR